MKPSTRDWINVVGEDDELSSLTPRALPGRAPAKRIWGEHGNADLGEEPVCPGQ
jgi:hypothetical protein